MDPSKWGNYNSTTKELTLGTTGEAVSPRVRVDMPYYLGIDGEFYTTTQANAQCSNIGIGCYHMGIAYFASDGITPVANRHNYQTNGCSMDIPLNQWSAGINECSFSGGTNIVYVAIAFYGSNLGHASPDYKVRNPTLIVTNQ